MANRKTISDVLRAAIKQSGLSHYRIAKDAGVEPDSIDRFVRSEDRKDLRLATAEKIADVLDLELRKRDS